MTRADAGSLGVLQLASLLLLRLAGFHMLLNRNLWHLLDTHLLQLDPLGSLLALHSQPPGMNALLALLVQLGAATGLSPEALGAPLYALLAGAALLLVFDAVLRLTGRRALAWLAAGLLLTDPAVHLFEHFLFYELLLYFLLTLATWAAVRLLEDGRTRHLALLTATLAGMGLTRSLYHPVFCLGGLGLVLVAERRLAPPRPGRPRALALAALVLTLALWPLKNRLVLGRGVMSSWVGYNLVNGLPVPADPDLDGFFRRGEVPAWAEAAMHERGLRHPALTAVDKGDGDRVRNWNHALFLLLDARLRARGWAWRRANPGTWARIALAQYLMATRAAFVHPYSQRLRSFGGAVHPAYAGAYQRVVFHDLRPWIEPWTPGLWVHDDARIQVGGPDQGRPVPYTLFGLVLLPGLFLASGVGLWRRRGAWGIREAMLALCLGAVAWPLVVACSSDGQEANRMRFASSGPLVVALCLLAAGRRESHGSPSQPASVGDGHAGPSDS